MDRNEIKKQIPGITDDQLTWLMAENGKDIAREQSVAETLRTQLKTAQDGLQAFEGVDVKELQGKVTELQNQLTAQADGFEYDSKVHAALVKAGAYNPKIAAAMLDNENLRKSQNRDADITAAVEKLVKDEAWAFKAADGGDGSVTVTTGGGHGAGGKSDGDDGVIARFRSLNPELKI